MPRALLSANGTDGISLLSRDATWYPLVESLLGGDCVVKSCGVVVAMPGCSTQYWHSDGGHVGKAAQWEDVEEPTRAAAAPHAICVFVPLVDLSRENGFTEFWSGSHLFDGLLAKKARAAGASHDPQPNSTPTPTQPHPKGRTDPAGRDRGDRALWGCDHVW